MRAQFNPFHLYFGTSAGAQNLSAYLCNQPGYGRKVIMRYTTVRYSFGSATICNTAEENP